MEDLFIKTKAINDGATPSPNGRDNPTALAGLAVSFQDLLHKAGIRIEAGLNAIADRAGISAVVERIKPPHPADDYRDRRSDGERDRFVEQARANDRADGRSDDRRVGRDDGYGRDRGVEQRDSRGDSGNADRGADRGADRADDYAGRQDGPANEVQGGDENSATNDDAGAGDDSAKTTESGGETQTAEGRSDGQNETVSAGTDAVTAQVGVSVDPTGQILAGLAAGGPAHTAEGQASDQGKLSAAEGLATAQENISKATPAASSKTDGSPGTHQAQANTSDQAKTVINAQSQVAVEAETGPADTTLQSQVAGLAKAVGEGNRVQVNVNVTQEAQNLVSKPGAALTANTVISGEGSSQSQTSQQGGANTHGGGQNAAAATAQQAQAGPTQTQAAQNTQALAQTGTDAKGLVQSSTASGNAGGSAHSGGGEGAASPNTGGVTGSQQAQQAQSQTAANQAHEAQKQARFGRTVVDQVFVKITKAIQAGNDKITIQLRPSKMGRVEVKMELTQDNRLTAVVTADTKETLDTLQKDAKELQKALQEAGLQTDAGDLSFNLRGQEGEDGDGSGRGGSLGDEDVADLDEIMEEAVVASDGGVLANGRIDLRV